MVSHDGRLIISLDFELLWGIFERGQLVTTEYFRRTRESIPRVLDLFNEFRISATWAVVGMLFHHDWDEWTSFIPENRPTYTNHYRDSYRFGLNARHSIATSSVFAPELIRQIASTPRQEIGTHTYSHFYCTEPGQTVDQFATDLSLASRMASEIGVSLQSLVFPRNQYNHDYLAVCHSLGIRTVRTNPDVWYWKEATSERFSVKFARTIDCYLPMSKKAYLTSKFSIADHVCLQPASRFLRPHSRFAIVNRARTRRIKSELNYAAKHSLIYHLWWHPHNFGNAPVESLINLRKILEHFRRLRDQYGFESMAMGNVVDLVG